MKRTLAAELARDAAIALVTWCAIFMPLAEIMAIRARDQEQTDKSASARRAAAVLDTCLKDTGRTAAAGDCLSVLQVGDPSVTSADWNFHHAFYLFTVTAAMPASVKLPRPRAAPGERGVASEIIGWLAGKSTRSGGAVACDGGSTGFVLCSVFAQERVRKAVALLPEPVRRRLEDAGPAVYGAFMDSSQHKSMRTWIALSEGGMRAQLESITLALKPLVEDAYLGQFYPPPKGLPNPWAAFTDTASRVFGAPFGKIFLSSFAFLTGAALCVLALVYLYLAWEVREHGGRRLLFLLALPTFSIAAVIRAAIIGLQQWIDQGNLAGISWGKEVLGLLDSHDHPYVACVLALFCAAVASGISFDLAQLMSLVARREGRQPHITALRTLGFHHGQASTPVAILAYFGRVFVELFSRRRGRFSAGLLERDILPFHLRGTEYNAFEVLRRRLPHLADSLIIAGVLFGLPTTAADSFLRAIRLEDITLILQGGTVVLLCGLFLRSIAAVVYFRLFGSAPSRSAVNLQGIHEQPGAQDAVEPPEEEATTPFVKMGDPDWDDPQGGSDRGGERTR